MCKRLRRIFFLSFIILFSLNSCVSAIVATALISAGGSVYYLSGNYIIEVPRDMRAVYNATLKTIQNSKSYTLESNKYNGKTATIKALYGSHDVSITLTNIKQRSCRVKIRFDMFGDEQKSADLANQIAKNLA